MQKDALNNVHITDEQVLMTPEQLKAAFPLSLQQEAQIADSRKTISDIIAGRDPRLLVVCGPCSIHDPETALEYARRFKALAAEVSDSLYLVMRVYFEKPPTKPCRFVQNHSVSHHPSPCCFTKLLFNP